MLASNERRQAVTREELVAEVAEAINKHESIAAKAVRIVVEACAETATPPDGRRCPTCDQVFEAIERIRKLGGTP